MITFVTGFAWVIYVIIATVVVGGALYLLNLSPIDEQVKKFGKFAIVFILIIVALLFLLQVVQSGVIAIK